MTRKLQLLCLALVFVMGCYGASVDSGLPPSKKVVKQAWAASWIYGLVPPKTIETAADCPAGVARVETRLSFVNQLVGFITLGIYTPMEISVTCAEGSGMSGQPYPLDISIDDAATPREIQDAFKEAARQAVKTKRPVFVQLASRDNTEVK